MMASNVTTSVRLSGDYVDDDSLSFAILKLILGPSQNIESVLEEIEGLLKDR